MNYYVAVEENFGNYHISLFNAVLVKPIVIPDLTLDGINTRSLDRRMNKVNWKEEDCDEVWRFISIDGRFYAKNFPIQKLISDVWRIGRSGIEGKDVAERLQMKYWCDDNCRFNILIENFHQLKEKFEIWSQFKVKDGSTLTMHDAYNLLNGKAVYKPSGIYNIDFSKRLPGGPYLLEHTTAERVLMQQQTINNTLKTATMIQII